MKKEKILDLVAIIFIFIIIFVLVINVPIIAKYKNTDELIINEVVPKNKNILLDSNGNHYDFIELYNGNDYDINLEGYHLSDDNFDLKKWTFPDTTIKSNSYLIVYTSGLDKYENEELHTNFKLNNKGEVLSLSNKKASVLSRIYYEKSEEDTSYGYNGKKYVYFYNPTPNEKNNSNYSNVPIKSNEKSNIKLKITNYTINNNSNIEITNTSNKDINLEGYFLSDNLNNKYKYMFPSLIIKANEKIVIAANKDSNNEIHTNFDLTNDDNIIILSDNYKKEIDKVYLEKESTEEIKDIQINEVSSIGNEWVELKNLIDKDINLDGYKIGDKSGKIASLQNLTIKANSFIIVYGSDNYYYNGDIYTGFHINNSTEKIYLYKNNQIIDEFSVGRIIEGITSGRNNNNERVYYTYPSPGKENSQTYYEGYASIVNFNINGGYIEKNTEIVLNTNDNSEIYYTTDGSFPNKNSQKYTSPIKIKETTTIKAIAYKDNYLPSEITSRTFIVGRKHTLPVISISTDNNKLFGAYGIISNYKQNTNKEISFEYYDKNGNLGVSFIGDTKLSGMDSREEPQKSMSIYLRKKYGLQYITYPFFKDNDSLTYSSLLLRNAGEDPKNIRIMDAVLTQTLKGKMDIDIQDYRPVVVYINNNYFGMFNLREKLNADYIESKFNISKDDVDLIKYTTPVKGSTTDYDSLVNYISSHDTRDTDVYNFIKEKIDIQELINYTIAQSYYGNTDLGNIRYWKQKDNGKFRWMLYDLDWSMWTDNRSISYPVTNGNIPAATYLYSFFTITRNLYKNAEFKDLYLNTLAYHLKNTFTPDRMNNIVDELASEVRDEMPYHIDRWKSSGSELTSMDKWENNINSFKDMITRRYKNIVGRLKSDFNLSEEEYKKYFGDVSV